MQFFLVQHSISIKINLRARSSKRLTPYVQLQAQGHTIHILPEILIQDRSDSCINVLRCMSCEELKFCRLCTLGMKPKKWQIWCGFNCLVILIRFLLQLWSTTMNCVTTASVSFGGHTSQSFSTLQLKFYVRGSTREMTYVSVLVEFCVCVNSRHSSSISHKLFYQQILAIELKTVSF